MKQTLLVCSAFVLMCSCVDVPIEERNTQELSDEEMKSRVEAEEIEFETGVN